MSLVKLTLENNWSDTRSTWKTTDAARERDDGAQRVGAGIAP